MRSRQYDPDVVGAGRRRFEPPQRPAVPADRGLVVEDAAGEFCGAVVCCEKDAVTLEDRQGRQRVFPLGPAPFLLEGQPVRLVRPAQAGAAGAPGGAAGAPGGAASRTPRTASGSIAPPLARAKVARASRIYVEGRHDAELVERIWGDDLREVGVVVEYLGGIDDLPAIVADFAPGAQRRLGVLVDHLVPGSKESRIAALVRSPHVLMSGTRSSTSGRRSSRPCWASAAGRRFRPARPGRRGWRGRWGGGRTPPRPGGTSWARCEVSRTWNLSSSAGSRS